MARNFECLKINTAYSYWKVICFSHIKKFPSGIEHPYFFCKCVCGEGRLINAYSLKNGHTKSCGCKRPLVQFRNLPKGHAAINIVYGGYKQTAKRRSISFNLSKDQFLEFTKDDCYYCGSKPANIRKMNSGNFIYNGIDRIDPTKGYSISNCKTCCKICNRAKSDLSYHEFQDWISKLIKMRQRV